MTFADQFRQWREAARLSQGDVAAALAIKQQTVSDWENGRSHPRRLRAAQVAAVLRVPLDEFLQALADAPPDFESGQDPEIQELAAKIRRLDPDARAVIDGVIDQMLKRPR